MIRDVQLKFEKNHKDEETILRKKMEDEHSKDQVKFRKDAASQQARLRKELLENQISNEENDLDNKALQKFEVQKKQEQDRKMRNIELQKQQLMRQLETEMKNDYADYEQMLARKREEQKQVEDKTASVREKLKERKDRLKKGGIGVGLTKEEQEQLLNRYKNQLEQLDSAYIAEQKRQALMMKQRQDMKMQRQHKLQAMQDKYQLEKKQEARGNLRAGLKNIIGNKNNLFEGDVMTLDTSELLRRLREWQNDKSEYDKQIYIHKLDQTEV